MIGALSALPPAARRERIRAAAANALRLHQRRRLLFTSPESISASMHLLEISLCLASMQARILELPTL
jgi:hypothetical protein